MTRPTHYYSCGITPSSSSRIQAPHTIDQYLTSTQQYPLRIVCGECDGATCKTEEYHVCPALLPVYVEGMNIEPDQIFSLYVAGEYIRYCLMGVIYYGTSHFTARYVDETGTVWFNDGYVQGRTCNSEGNILEVDKTASTDGRKPVLAVYRQL